MSEGSGGTPWSKSPLHGMSSGIGFYSEGLSGLFDQILQSSAARAYGATEGMYTATEEAFETAQRDLRDIQMTVPQDQQADALAEYLRNSGYSSHVVEQTLGIPREEVDAALAAAGYTVTGDALPTNTKSPLELLQTGPTKTTDSSDSSATSADSMTGDDDLEGSLDTITAGLESSSTASTDNGGFKVGDIVTDDRISGDYSFVYDAEQNVFHYLPYDAAGNRIYKGETIDASTVAGWTGTTTGDTASILFNEDGTPYIESAAETTDGSTDGTINITLNTTGAVGADAANIITGSTGGTATINNTGSLGTDTTGTTTGTTTTTGGDGNVTVINGTDGEDGRDGVDGTDGRDGVDGRDGADGADGAKGDKGDKGDKGERGASGVIALTAPIANKLFGDQFVFEDVIKPEFLGLLNLRGRR